MGVVNPTRVQVQLLKPDLAFGVVSWTMRYPENAHASEIVGTTTMDTQKFETDWKNVAVQVPSQRCDRSLGNNERFFFCLAQGS